VASFREAVGRDYDLMLECRTRFDRESAIQLLPLAGAVPTDVGGRAHPERQHRCDGQELVADARSHRNLLMLEWTHCRRKLRSWQALIPAQSR
jgi:hypothetical protein